MGMVVQGQTMSDEIVSLGLSKSPHVWTSPEGLLCIDRIEQAYWPNLLFQLVWVICNNLLFHKLATSDAFRDTLRAWTYWSMSRCVRIEDHVRSWPAKAFLCCHHRKGLRTLDCCAQYLPYAKTLVITDLNENPWTKPFSRAIYGNISISRLPSNEKHWTLVKSIQSADALSVFPARDGSTFWGDTSMSFRTGLFAASILTGLPIINMILVEPTPAQDVLDIEFTLWLPPNIAPNIDSGFTVRTADEYSRWREQHATLIAMFTRACEIDYKARLYSIEARKASCSLHGNEVCTLKEEAFTRRALRRNKMASEIFRESLAKLC